MDEIFVSPVLGGMVQTSIEIIPNSLSKFFVQGALDRFPSDRCDAVTVYLYVYRDLYLLVGGWTNPSEKYESNWVHLPPNRGEVKKNETTT